MKKYNKKEKVLGKAKKDGLTIEWGGFIPIILLLVLLIGSWAWLGISGCDNDHRHCNYESSSTNQYDIKNVQFITTGGFGFQHPTTVIFANNMIIYIHEIINVKINDKIYITPSMRGEARVIINDKQYFGDQDNNGDYQLN